MYSKHSEWLSCILSEPLPIETRATCDNCVMCHEPVDGVRSPRFNTDTKCCTYWPSLPNYLVGGALAANEPAALEGASRILRLINFAWATPVALGASPGHRLLYSATSQTEFGKSALLKCPYYVDGPGFNCSIWKYQNGVCSTWFCRHERGAIGQSFWDVVRALLTVVEQRVAIWCARELGITDEGVVLANEFIAKENLKGQTLDGDARNDTAERMWAHWNGRREEFYIECFKLVGPLSWAEVQAHCGIDASVLGNVAAQRHEKLRDTGLPASIQLRPYKVLGEINGSPVVAGYSDADPVVVEAEVFDQVRRWKTVSREDALSCLRGLSQDNSEGVQVRKLWEVGVLAKENVPQ